MVSTVSAAGKITDVAGKASGVLGSIADYWGLGRWLDRRSRSKDVDAAVERYESLYGTGMPDEVRDLLYAKYVAESRKLDNLTEVLSIVRDARRGRDDTGTMPQQDWLDAFEDGASHAYDDEVRAMWAQLLAGELDHPGSFSKRTLRTLTDMNAEEAELFRRVCACSVEWRVWNHFTDDSGHWYRMPLLASYSEPVDDRLDFDDMDANGLWKEEIAPLEDAQLLSQTNGWLYATGTGPATYLQIRYQGRSGGPWRTLTLRSVNQMETARFGSGIAFTKTGQELSSLCDDTFATSGYLPGLIDDIRYRMGLETVEC